MKIAVVGAGSVYTPTLVDQVVSRNSGLDCHQIAMFDPDPARLDAIVGLSRRLVEGSSVRISTSQTLEQLVEDAEFITTSVRVGGLKGRLTDYQLANEVGLIGQETVGVGGLAFALRSIPVMMRLADVVAKIAPNAWIINGTNPDGMVTRALLRGGHERSIGLCDIPFHIQKFFADYFNVDRRDVVVEGTGLNHLTWYDRIYIKGVDRTDEFWASGGAESYQPLAANIPPLRLPVKFLTALRLFPSPYLNYFYFPQQILNAQLAGGIPRAKVCMNVERELFAAYRDETTVVIPTIMAKRGGARFCEVIVDLMTSMINSHRDTQIANVRNGSAIRELSPDSVVEVPCCIHSNGATPLARPPLPATIRGIVQAMDAYEDLILDGIERHERAPIIEAMLIHPLIGDLTRANVFLDKLFAAFPDSSLAHLAA